MSQPNWVRIGSALISGLQVVNAGLTALHPPAWVPLAVAATLMALQSLMNEGALQTQPPIK